MTIPTSEDTKPLQALSTAEIERWLRVGLEGLLLEGKGPWAFEPLGLFIGETDHIAFDLSYIYEASDAKLQGRIRQAVADLLGHLEVTTRNVPLFESLLLIAATLPAPEIFNVLPSCIAVTELKRSPSDPRSTLFAAALTTVADIATPTHESLRCLRKLVTLPRFEPAYSGIALVALCRVAPDEFVSHFEMLRASLARMFQEYALDSETVRNLAIEVYESIPLVTLVDHFHALRVYPVSAPRNSDEWFLQSLVAGRAPLISIVREDDFEYLMDMRTGVRVRLPTPMRSKPAVWKSANDDFVPASESAKIAAALPESERGILKNFKDLFRQPLLVQKIRSFGGRAKANA